MSDEKTRITKVIKPAVAAVPFPTTDLDGSHVQLIAGVAAADDAAVLRISGDIELVLTTDYVRGPKFRLAELGLLKPYDLGYFLAVANLSDLAAMGATPLALLPVIRYPPDFDDASFRACFRGVVDSAKRASASVIGGDTGTAERLILSATAVGVRKVGSTFYRDAAKPGDDIFVSGPVGRAAAAIVYFTLRAEDGIRQLPQRVEADLLAAWRRPRPRTDVTQALLGVDERMACQDVSDGLKATIEEICQASQVGAVIDSVAVPIAESARRVADAIGVDAQSLAFGVSVDFELVCMTSSRTAASSLVRVGARRIGQVVEGSAARLRNDAGRLVELPGTPWRNQPDDVLSVILS